jgi:hypothetical protein
MVTCPGSIRDAISKAKTIPLPLALSRANAYPAGIEEANVPRTVSTATIHELANDRKNVKLAKKSVKFWGLGFFGMNAVGVFRISENGLREVEKSQMTGARQMISPKTATTRATTFPGFKRRPSQILGG